MKKLLCAVAMMSVSTVASAQGVDANGNAVQTQIERTIGSLVVQNAQCSSQVMTLTEQLRAAQKELEELKKGKK